jgi:hypothetical protein
VGLCLVTVGILENIVKNKKDFNITYYSYRLFKEVLRREIQGLKV